ncbi:MAG: NAD(P) transhydrogenase subunit alpha [Pirellulales bacterium]|nr:NAD(P) transhydrogenase subunit alpha [Pirellulales bacterium]
MEILSGLNNFALFAAETATAESAAPPSSIVINITIFVLACFVGYEIITKIPPLLHTPLMSGSNAISGITLVGSLVAASSGFASLFSYEALISVLGFFAVLMATINVVGGFVVTDRMLGMFKRKD